MAVTIASRVHAPCLMLCDRVDLPKSTHVVFVSCLLALPTSHPRRVIASIGGLLDCPVTCARGASPTLMEIHGMTLKR
jgi:hypothetical protein